MEPSLIIGKPKKYTLFFIVNLNLLIPALGYILGIGFTLGIFVLIRNFLGESYYLIPIGIGSIITYAVAIYLIPVINGNPWVSRLVKKTLEMDSLDGNAVICQIKFTPQLHGGIRGFIEDADDVGYIQFGDESISFSGDQIQLVLPYSSLKSYSHFNAGWRGLWLTGRKIRIETDAFEGYEFIESYERQSTTVLTSRKISAALINEFERIPEIKKI